MNPTLAVALISLAKEVVLAWMDMQGKTEITKDDLVTKTPDAILAEMGITVK